MAASNPATSTAPPSFLPAGPTPDPAVVDVARPVVAVAAVVTFVVASTADVAVVVGTLGLKVLEAVAVSSSSVTTVVFTAVALILDGDGDDPPSVVVDGRLAVLRGRLDVVGAVAVAPPALVVPLIRHWPFPAHVCPAKQ
ncbi:hypothetical protein CH63R_08257 [Colletotrichum higginsianum IMI 349063]|uniref:Uncharacterized protein n=1 Tax=Colletotrichum higginsianum (strain IMI 349063) TaxID=759273 RepID=A0A1B7YBP5_COLHI|nr:hypothetical protein CH63R_08257 [Colletotrichum higginsianum IMI 349063]OBR09492.1 hypothetical protein CH63R_08257 [Colletotrichum higginsianum IMI 349063]